MSGSRPSMRDLQGARPRAWPQISGVPASSLEPRHILQHGEVLLRFLRLRRLRVFAEQETQQLHCRLILLDAVGHRLGLKQPGARNFGALRIAPVELQQEAHYGAVVLCAAAPRASSSWLAALSMR